MKITRITLPDNFDFETDIPVLFGDINYGNHLSNDAILRMTNEARIRFFYSMGLSDFDISEGDGVTIMMRNAVIVYKGEGFHGDIINTKVALGEYENYDFELFFQLIRRSDSKEIARVQCDLVCADIKKRTLTKVPESFINKINLLKQQKK